MNRFPALSHVIWGAVYVIDDYTSPFSLLSSSRLTTNSWSPALCENIWSRRQTLWHWREMPTEIIYWVDEPDSFIRATGRGSDPLLHWAEPHSDCITIIHTGTVLSPCAAVHVQGDGSGPDHTTTNTPTHRKLDIILMFIQGLYFYQM